MKRILLAFISFSIWANSNAQTVFTYGKNAVPKEEFLRAFNKNPTTASDRKKALREYLDLYINFKLKVQAAYDAGLDKDQTQQYELQNFRKQIADNIINDQANMKALVKEAFTRSQKDIHLAQIFIEVPAKGDTVEAYKKIHEAYKALQQGKDFTKVAEEYSSDPGSKQTGGDLGYITAFTLPYEYENIAYSIGPNTYTAPVRTAIGYHIFKNKGERKPLGSRKVAQILIAFPPNASDAERALAQRKADSVYQIIQKQKNFEEMVSAVSNDLSTNGNKGQLPEFGIGTYNPTFEEAAFALKTVGEVSKPIATNYGVHILKLLEIKPVAADEKDELYMASLQEKVSKDGRLTKAKKALVGKQLAMLKYKPGIYKEENLFKFTDSNYQQQTFKPYYGLNENTVLFSFATQNIKASDWLKFVRAVKSTPNEFSGKSYKELMADYVRTTADEYYRNNLEKYSPEFDKQVKEFKDANLLFGIMDKNVWGKANEDNKGLMTYYDQHKEKYTWAPSADALIVTCATEALATELQQKLTNNLTNWRSITDTYGTQVTADSGRYELSQLPVFERTRFTAGLLTTPVKNTSDGTYTFNYIVKLHPQKEPRSFEDARGMVISDYQQVLEDQWIASLKKKYPVKVNDPVFTTIK
jgi:peptidyl-prolyl cis-trans isomerase SurA